MLSRQTFFLALTIPICLALYSIYKLKQLIYRKLEAIKLRTQGIKHEKRQIDNLLNIEIIDLNFEEIKALIKNLQEKLYLCRRTKEFSHFERSLRLQIENARKKLGELNYEIRVDELDFKKKRIELEIKNLKEEKERKQDEEKDRLERVALDLHMPQRNAFFKDSVFSEEIDILHANGYEDSNQYDVVKKKIIPVLVKKIMNHTPQHTFLVWSVERFLQMIEGVKYLQHYDTRYPDIAFTYDELDYALEIETGPLLRKKSQATKKVKYLNKHYPGRWMFIVSNKNLLPAYRKLGPATQRSEVVKVIKKMLEIST